MNVAVVLYPGMNCEDESARALASVGVPAEIVRANEGARLRASIQSFREDLQRLETPEADADADAGADSGDRGPDSAPRAAAGAQGHA